MLGVRGKNGIDTVRKFVCYDDLDPMCLAGGYIDFHAVGFARLWAECRLLNLDVLGDIHTHPGPDSSQSETDRTHPMINEKSYVGVIVPRYAQGWPFRLNVLSIYEYQGNYEWRDWSGPARTGRMRLTWW